MKLKYTEQDFEFFKFYKKEIMPILENFEDSRYKTANSCLKLKKILTIIFIIMLVIFSIIPIAYIFKLNFVFKYLSSNVYLFAGSLIFQLIAIAYLTFAPILYGKHARIEEKDFTNKIKKDCLQKVLNNFGEIIWCRHSAVITKEELKNSGLFAYYNEEEIDDSFTGKYNGVKFKIQETKMCLARTKSKDYVFNGIILSFETNKTIKNRTLVATKGDYTSKKQDFLTYGFMIILPIYTFLRCIADSKPESIIYAIISFIAIVLAILAVKRYTATPERIDKVEIEDPEFNKNFIAYSSDQIEARYALTPSFINRLKNLQTAFGEKNIKCSFFKNQVIIAIQTKKDLFELGNLYKSINSSEFINTLFNELKSVQNMITYFKFDEKTGL